MKNILFVFLVALLSACGRPGADYLGKWQAGDGKHFVEISQNGDSLLLKITEPAYKGLFISQPGNPGNTSTTTLPGTIKDGLLKVDGPLGGVTITYVKGSDTLLFPNFMGGNTEYKRAK